MEVMMALLKVYYLADLMVDYLDNLMDYQKVEKMVDSMVEMMANC